MSWSRPLQLYASKGAKNAKFVILIFVNAMCDWLFQFDLMRQPWHDASEMISTDLFYAQLGPSSDYSSGVDEMTGEQSELIDDQGWRSQNHVGPR